MELEIVIIFTGPYQRYKLFYFPPGINFSSRHGDPDVPHGWTFTLDSEIPAHAVKKIKTFKKFPTIRQALMDACTSWIEGDSGLYYIDEHLAFFEINGVEKTPDHLPQILNFI